MRIRSIWSLRAAPLVFYGREAEVEHAVDLIVHQAPAFGEDDHRVALAQGIVSPEEMPPCPIDDSGRFTEAVPDFVGQHVKAADKDIQRVLKQKIRKPQSRAAPQRH